VWTVNLNHLKMYEPGSVVFTSKKESFSFPLHCHHSLPYWPLICCLHFCQNKRDRVTDAESKRKEVLLEHDLATVLTLAE
jgi:hypothetical protein